MQFRMFSLAVLALTPWAMASLLHADDFYQDGKLVSIAENKITLTCSKNKEHVFTISPATKVKRDGVTCKCEELSPDTRIRVFTTHDDRQQVIAVEAIDRIGHFDGTHDGKLVSITENKLVMTGKKGNEHSHVLSANAKCILDGQTCQWDALKPGSRIRVTTRTENGQSVVRLEAIDKEALFTGTQDGKYVSNTANHLVMTNKAGNEQTLHISANASVLCDGETCKVENLKAGMRIRVSSLTEDHTLINRIEALNKKNAFDLLN